MEAPATGRLSPSGRWRSRLRAEAKMHAKIVFLLLSLMTNETRLGKVEDFSLHDSTGKLRTHAEWKNHKAVVLFFLNTECPVANFYAADFERIAKSYRERGVAVYGIYSDPNATPSDVRSHADEYRLSFSLLLDPEQKLARSTGATVTPEAVVLSADGTVRYRGRIDDRYSPDGKRRDEPRSRDLEAALAAVLADKAPPVAVTRAFGCPLPRPKTTSP
jgi:peroxiredoxin